MQYTQELLLCKVYGRGGGRWVGRWSLGNAYSSNIFCPIPGPPNPTCGQAGSPSDRCDLCVGIELEEQLAFMKDRFQLLELIDVRRHPLLLLSYPASQVLFHLNTRYNDNSPFYICAV